MRSKMLISVLAFVFLSACNAPQSKKPKSSSRDGLFVHISSGYDNPKKVLMGLSLAARFSDESDVCVFFDLEGVKLLTEVSADLSLQHYQSLQTSIQQLFENGATIMACPMCLKSANIEPSDLVEGVVVAQKEHFFGFTKGRIITLDY